MLKKGATVIKQMMRKLAHKFPTYLPVGKEEFDKFFQDIVDTYGYPNKPGYKELIGNLIQHTKEDRVKIPKAWFARAIRKAQANETAYWAIQEAKKDGEEQARIEKEKQEVTLKELKPVEPSSAG